VRRIVAAVVLLLALPAQAGQNDRVRRSAGRHSGGDSLGACCGALCDLIDLADFCFSVAHAPAHGRVVVVTPPPPPPPRTPPPVPPPAPAPPAHGPPTAEPQGDIASEEPPDDAPTGVEGSAELPPDALAENEDVSAPPVPPEAAMAGPAPSVRQPWPASPSAPQAPPPEASGPRPARESTEFGLDFTLQYALAADPIVAPRLGFRVEIPMAVPNNRLRFDADQIVYIEREPETLRADGARLAAHWDRLPLTGLRMGWLVGDGRVSGGAGLGLGILDAGIGAVGGLDLAALVRFEGSLFLAEAAARLLLFESITAVEGRASAGARLGPVRLTLAWRHLEFVDEEGPIPYTGPEVGVGLVF